MTLSWRQTKPTILKKVHSSFYDFKINSRYFTYIKHIAILYSHFTITWYLLLLENSNHISRMSSTSAPLIPFNIFIAAYEVL